MGNKQIIETEQKQDFNSPNVLIKEARVANVPVVKQDIQILSIELIYESVDKVQIDLLLNSSVIFEMSVYQFVTETKSLRFGNQQKFERGHHRSTYQRFMCPAQQYLQIPTNQIEFMIVDVINFSKNKATSSKTHFDLVIELKHQDKQWLYFYQIHISDSGYECTIQLAKEALIFQGQMFEISELFGIKNTVFNAEWNPNIIEDKECVICFSNMINTVLLPCRHMCTCNICSEFIMKQNKLCPLCRLDINNYLALDLKDEQKRQIQIDQYRSEKLYLDAQIQEKKQIVTLKQSQIVLQIQQMKQEKLEQEKLLKEIEEKQKKQRIGTQQMQFLDNINELNCEMAQDLQNFDCNSEQQKSEGSNPVQQPFQTEISLISRDEPNMKKKKQRRTPKIKPEFISEDSRVDYSPVLQSKKHSEYHQESDQEDWLDSDSRIDREPSSVIPSNFFQGDDNDIPVDCVDGILTKNRRNSKGSAPDIPIYEGQEQEINLFKQEQDRRLSIQSQEVVVFDQQSSYNAPSYNFEQPPIVIYEPKQKQQYIEIEPRQQETKKYKYQQQQLCINSYEEQNHQPLQQQGESPKLVNEDDLLIFDD